MSRIEPHCLIPLLRQLDRMPENALCMRRHRHFDLAPLLTALAAVSDSSLMINTTPATLGSLRELLALTIPGVEDWLGKRLSWSEPDPRPTLSS
jgi:hypothetical protein